MGAGVGQEDAGDLPGIQVLDPVIIGDGRWVSLRDRGVIRPAGS